MGGLRRLNAADLPRLREFWRKHWSGEEIHAHGQIIRPEQVEGFVHGDEKEETGNFTDRREWHPPAG